MCLYVKGWWEIILLSVYIFVGNLNWLKILMNKLYFVFFVENERGFYF